MKSGLFARPTIGTVLSIGSNHTTVAVYEAVEGVVQRLELGRIGATGVRNGDVEAPEATATAIRKAWGKAENAWRDNRRLPAPWVAFSGAGLASFTAPAAFDLDGEQIEPEHCEDLLAVAGTEIRRRGLIGPDARVVHVEPTLYQVDALRNVLDPCGMHARRLAVDIHCLTAGQAALDNLRQAVATANLPIARLVPAPMASAAGCLTPEARDAGVALVDVGRDMTSVAVYGAGRLLGLRMLEGGGRRLTLALAREFRLDEADANRLKHQYGSAQTVNADAKTSVPLGSGPVGVAAAAAPDGAQPDAVSLLTFNAALAVELDRQLRAINLALTAMRYPAGPGALVVLTGGGAQLRGLAPHAETVLGRKVVTGAPLVPGGARNLTARFDTSDTTVVGLARLAAAAAPDPMAQLWPETATSRSAPLARLWRVLREAL